MQQATSPGRGEVGIPIGAPIGIPGEGLERQALFASRQMG